MDKKQLSEIDICEKFISPAIALAGWSIHDQIYREYPLRVGRVTVRGNRSHRDQSTVLRADYALFYKANIPIAVVEAKDNNKAMVVDDALIYAIYEALEANGDMTRTWRDAKHTTFKRVFGSGPRA